MSKMRIALFTGYGSGSGQNEELNRILASEPFPRNRMGEILDFLEVLPDCSEDVREKGLFGNAFAQYVTDKGAIKMAYGHGVYQYFIANGNEHPIIVSINEVDTSKPWTIKEYDGSEHVEVLDYEIIDPEIYYVTQKD